jgi:hypothetical protein
MMGRGCLAKAVNILFWQLLQNLDFWNFLITLLVNKSWCCPPYSCGSTVHTIGCYHFLQIPIHNFTQTTNLYNRLMRSSVNVKHFSWNGFKLIDKVLEAFKWSSLQETGDHNNVLVVAFYTREDGGYVSSNISKPLPQTYAIVYNIFVVVFLWQWESQWKWLGTSTVLRTFWELCGNTLGTLWDRFGKSARTKGLCIPYCTNTIWYAM